MSILEKLKNDEINALKRGEQLKLNTLRFLKSAVHNEEIAAGKAATEETIINVIQRQIKQRQESIEGFKAGNRADLVEKETAELEILRSYLPEQISEEEIRSAVERAIKETSAASTADIGKVMGRLSTELKGKANMSLVSNIVREKLS